MLGDLTGGTLVSRMNVVGFFVWTHYNLPCLVKQSLLRWTLLLTVATSFHFYSMWHALATSPWNVSKPYFYMISGTLSVECMLAYHIFRGDCCSCTDNQHDSSSILSCHKISSWKMQPWQQVWPKKKTLRASLWIGLLLRSMEFRMLLVLNELMNCFVDARWLNLHARRLLFINSIN